MTFEYVIPKPLATFNYGTLPVSYLAASVFPRWIEHHPFDRAWAGLHLALGIAFWYAVGRFGETKRLWRIGLLLYVAFRTVTLPLSLYGHGYSILDGVTISLWFVAFAVGISVMLVTILRKGLLLLVGRRHQV